ncbi:GroES-like protein [Glonium stellatum]|uniref:GroES-like protein n=1 Tax=Glonium stellatum TaxID=574774 RepID=A0A8E2FBK3_9PEZI|nr:GroES-like protein [Glonium stellatum]
MEALILDAASKTAKIEIISLPFPSPNEIVVRVGAIALNPVDALYVFNPLGRTGRVIGSDFAGTVESFGADLPSLNPHIRVGQRVAGFLQGASSVNDRPGAFSQYLSVPHDLVWHVQDNMSLEKAATVSLCALTAAQCLYYRLGLPAPFSYEGSHSSNASSQRLLTVFIYSASTSVGLYAAQLIQLSSKSSGTPIRLLGAASPSHHSILTRRPYEFAALVSYRDSDWPSQVRSLANGQGADFALDCISEGSSVAQVASVLAPCGKMAVVRSREGQAWKTEGTLPSEPLYGAVWEGLGDETEYQNMILPASPRARQFAVSFYRYLSSSEIPIQPNRVRLMPGGLNRIVPDGFTLMGPGTMNQRGNDRAEEWMKPVSGEKLVYSLSAVGECDSRTEIRDIQ